MVKLGRMYLLQTHTWVKVRNHCASKLFSQTVPRYFFDLHNDVDVHDHEGKDLPNLDAARANALIEAREMMTESIKEGKLNLNHRIEVRDDSSAVIYVLHFGEAVRVIPEQKASST